MPQGQEVIEVLVGGDVQATVVKLLGSGAGKGNIKLLELWARHFFKKIK